MSSVERIDSGARAAAAGAAGTREWVLEVVREGYLLHYGDPRTLEGTDEDLKLLGGDAMYAIGLARLAEEGDLEAVGVLADLISDSAQAEAEGRATDALWAAAAERLARPKPAE